MVGKVLVSRNGISFTLRSLATMREFMNTVRRGNQIAIAWAVTFDADGELQIGLCGYYEPPPFAIEDKIDELVFYWCALEPAMNAMRRYCVDLPWEATARLIPIGTVAKT